MKNIFVLFYFISFINAQLTATTNDGKKVLLNNDGTWNFVESKKSTIEGTGMWKVGYFVDEFGDPTDVAYIRNKNYIKGVFSNSATTNEELIAGFIITKTSVSIQLYEYAGNHPVKGITRLDSDYIILVKHNSSKLKLYGKNTSDRVTLITKITHRDYLSRGDFKSHMISKEKLLDALKEGGSLSFVITQGGSTYKFKIDDSTGFDVAYRQLK